MHIAWKVCWGRCEHLLLGRISVTSGWAEAPTRAGLCGQIQSITAIGKVKTQPISAAVSHKGRDAQMFTGRSRHPSSISSSIPPSSFPSPLSSLFLETRSNVAHTGFQLEDYPDLLDLSASISPVMGLQGCDTAPSLWVCLFWNTSHHVILTDLSL